MSPQRAFVDPCHVILYANRYSGDFLGHAWSSLPHLMYDNPYDWAYLRTHRRLRQGSIAKALAQL
jgi:hypothetical protein